MDKKNKTLACVMGIAGVCLSVYTSQRGFVMTWGEIQTEERVTAWLLALLAHAAQMVLISKGRLNWSLIISAAAAYVYSIYTNAAYFHGLSSGGGWGLPLTIGVILDVLPEPLINWACNNDNGDIASNIVDFLQGDNLSNPAPKKRGK